MVKYHHTLRGFSQVCLISRSATWLFFYSVVIIIASAVMGVNEVFLCHGFTVLKFALSE